MQDGTGEATLTGAAEIEHGRDTKGRGVLYYLRCVALVTGALAVCIIAGHYFAEYFQYRLRGWVAWAFWLDVMVFSFVAALYFPVLLWQKKTNKMLVISILVGITAVFIAGLMNFILFVMIVFSPEETGVVRQGQTEYVAFNEDTLVADTERVDQYYRYRNFLFCGPWVFTGEHLG